MKAIKILICAFPLLSCFAWSQATFKDDINWAKGNTTGIDQLNCSEQYVGIAASCLIGGGRSCVIGRAIAQAKAQKCGSAFDLVLITQCHDNGKAARDRIHAAGPAQVCSYLATLDPPPPPPAATNNPNDPKNPNNPNNKNKTADRVGAGSAKN